jgi:hypothetical protein
VSAVAVRHRNVLMPADASRAEAVFSRKCATRGAGLFDVARCTFWGDRFHPRIAAIDAWSFVEHDDAPRHHCCELHLAWTGDDASLARIVEQVSTLLERGPRR